MRVSENISIKELLSKLEKYGNCMLAGNPLWLGAGHATTLHIMSGLTYGVTKQHDFKYGSRTCSTPPTSQPGFLTTHRQKV